MRLLVVSLLALSLASCQTPGIPGLTSPAIVNPVNSVDIYRVKNVYAATLELAKKWRSYCYEVPYSQILTDPIRGPVCKNRRAVVRQIQKYQPIAGTAVRKADEFVKNNPTISAAGAIGIAWDAVSQFQGVVPIVR